MSTNLIADVEEREKAGLLPEADPTIENGFEKDESDEEKDQSQAIIDGLDATLDAHDRVLSDIKRLTKSKELLEKRNLELRKLRNSIGQKDLQSVIKKGFQP